MTGLPITRERVAEIQHSARRHLAERGDDGRVFRLTTQDVIDICQWALDAARDAARYLYVRKALTILDANGDPAFDLGAAIDAEIDAATGDPGQPFVDSLHRAVNAEPPPVIEPAGIFDGLMQEHASAAAEARDAQ